MFLQTNQLVSLTINSEPIGEGAEGSVYEVLAPELYLGYVVKVYKPIERLKNREEKINYLIKYAPKLKNPDSVIFPEEVIYDNGIFAGFLMKKAKGEYDLTSLCTLQDSPRLTAEWHEKYTRNTPQGIKNRLKLCYNIATAFNQVHATRRFTFVDIKPENIKISLDGTVSIVDIDSVAISDGYDLLFPAEKLTQEYSPMEYKDVNFKEDIIDETWDRFSLGILFYKVLFGLHPYSGTTKDAYGELTSNEQKIAEGLFPMGDKKEYFSTIPDPHLRFKEMPRNLQNLFLNCFEDGHLLPHKRPSAEQWCKALAKVNPKGYNPYALNYTKKEKKQVEKPKVKKESRQITVNPNSGTFPAVVMMICFIIISFLAVNSSERASQKKLQETYQDLDEEVEKTAFHEKMELIDDYDYVRTIQENVTWVLENGKYGLVSADGQKLTDIKYTWAGQFKNGFAIVEIEGAFGFVNLKGEEVTEIAYNSADSFEDDMALVSDNFQFFFIDSKGKFLFALDYDKIQKFKEGLAAFEKNGLWGFIDKTGKEIVPAQFKNAYPFGKDGLALVQNTYGVYGYIAKQGKLAIPFQYEHATSFHVGKATVTLKGKEVAIDVNGKILY